jgi:hypothetical protein
LSHRRYLRRPLLPLLLLFPHTAMASSSPLSFLLRKEKKKTKTKTKTKTKIFLRTKKNPTVKMIKSLCFRS